MDVITHGEFGPRRSAPAACPGSGVATQSARLRQRRSSAEELLHVQARGGNREELPHSRGQGPCPRGAPPRPRSGAAAERGNPTSKEQLLHWRRKAERSYSMFKVRRGGHEEIPLVQGKEQRLRFAGAAVKRYPTSKARETQVRR